MALASKCFNKGWHSHPVNVKRNNQFVIHRGKPVIIVRFWQTIRLTFCKLMCDDCQIW